MNCDKKDLLLYAVTDRAWLNGETLCSQVEKAIKGGATFIQLREKNLDQKHFLEEALEIQKLCKKYNVPFVINDNVEIAKEIDADGVHVGQSDMEAGNVRKILGDDKIIGVSAQTVEQALLAQKHGADYLGKIVFLEIKDIGEEQSAFDKIKELERLKYSFCPEEFMTRASAFNMREQIRVSKKAVKNGVTFSDYGSSLIKAYLKFPMVKSVQIIFITDFDRFNELGMICDKVRQTTDALNHILDNVLLDCNTCNLKSICDEVEGMKELHMKNAAKKQ